MRRIINHPIVFIGLLAVILIASLLFFFINWDNRSVIRTYFFPDNSYSVKRVEERSIPLFKSKQENLAAFVKDYLLGPVDLECAPVFPRGTKLNALIFADGKVYVDLDIDVRKSFETVPLSAKEMELYLTENLTHNFHYVEEITLTFGGELPGEVPFD